MCRREIQSFYISLHSKTHSVVALGLRHTHKKTRVGCYLIPVKRERDEKIYDTRSSCNIMSFAYVDLDGRGTVFVCSSERLEGLDCTTVGP